MSSSHSCKRFLSIRYYYDQMLKAADSPRAFWICCMVAFAESSFFPLPPDLIMIPMGMSNRKIVFKLALYLTFFSVVGGFLGYAIGYYLFGTIGAWIIETYHLQTAMDKFQQDFAHYGFWIIALKGLTPIPYKLVTIASGVAKFDLLQFGIASLIARGFRFFLLATLLWFFGPMAKPYIEKYLGIVMAIILGGIVFGFVIVKIFYC
jgi:membrane protein YqaA with SNARE-associated domain